MSSLPVVGLSGDTGIADLYGGLSPAEQDYVRSTLSQYVPSAVDDAARAIEGLGPAANQAISALGSGNAATAVEGSIPLIAGGLAAFGGPVGLAAAGVISAGGYAFGLLADALHLGAQPQEVCSWLVGEVCFNRTRAYGPSQPNGTPNPDWLRIEDFANTTLAMNGDWHSHNAIPVVGHYASWLNVAFDDVDIDDIGWELWSLGDHVSPAAKAWRDNKVMGGWKVDDATGQLDNGAGYKLDSPARVLAGTPQGEFLMAFYRAYVHSLEFVINGYQQPDTYGLLVATKAAFDRQHSASGTWTFEPSPRSAPGTGTWLERYLAGQYTQGHTEPPITINVGKPVDLGGVFFKFARETAPRVVPKSIKLRLGHMTPAQSKALVAALQQGKSSAPANDDFTVFGRKVTVLGKTVTKRQALAGGVVVAVLAKLLA